MKKMSSLLLLLALLPAFGDPVPVSQKSAVPIRIEPIDANGIGYSAMLFNYDLTNTGTTNDTLTSDVFDIRKLALVRHYDGDSNLVAVRMDSLLGQVTASCYDIRDSAVVTDSVDTKFTIQGSDYASNNSDPLTSFSDSWYTIRTITLQALSASQAQVTQDTAKVNLPVSTHSTQFIRVVGENLSGSAQNDTRCRLFLYRPRWVVQ